jgi:hypothetical protein
MLAEPVADLAAVEEGEPGQITAVCTEPTGSSYTVAAAPRDTVRDLEDRLTNVSGIPKDERRLVHRDEQLHNDCVTLRDLGIVEGEVAFGLVPVDPTEGARLRRAAKVTALREGLRADATAAVEELGAAPRRMMLCTAGEHSWSPWKDKHMRYFRFTPCLQDGTVQVSWGKNADGSNQSAGAFAWLGCGSAPPKRRTVASVDVDVASSSTPSPRLVVHFSSPVEGCVRFRLVVHEEVGTEARRLEGALKAALQAAWGYAAIGEAEAEALVDQGALTSTTTRQSLVHTSCTASFGTGVFARWEAERNPEPDPNSDADRRRILVLERRLAHLRNQMPE